MVTYETKINNRLVQVYKSQGKTKEFASIYNTNLHNGQFILSQGQMNKTIIIPLSVLRFDWKLFMENLHCQHTKQAMWTNRIKLYIERWEYKEDAYKKQILLQCFGCGQWHKFYIRNLDMDNETKKISIQWLHEFSREEEDLFEPDDNLYEIVLH